MNTPRKPAQAPIEPEWEPAPSTKKARPTVSAAPPPSSSASGRRTTEKTVVGSDVQALALRNSEASAFLLVCMGPNVGHRYPLFDRILMGRSDNADITLADDRVSGKHCEVVRSAAANGGFMIRDLGSSNGTLVNAQKISESELREGDLVQVGYTVFKFQSAAGARVERVPDPQVLGPNMGGMPGMGMGGMGMGGMPGMGMGGMPGMGMGGMPGMGMGMGGMPGMGMGMGMNGMPMQPGMGMGMGMPMPPTQVGPPAAEQEMNLEEMVGNVRKIVDIFRPHAKLIVAMTFVGLVGGVALAIASPPGAKSTFEMNILKGADGGPGNVATDRATAAKSNFKSTVLLRRTLETLGQGNDAGDDRIAVLQKNLNFESTTPNFGMPPPVQNFVGDFSASTEENALLFLDTHVKTFIDSEVEKTTNVLSSKLKYLTEQIAKAEATLRASDEELKDFKIKYLASLPENVAKLQEQIFELEKNKTELSSNIQQLKLEIVGASASGGGASRKAKLVKQIRDEIADLKAQGLGDNHPDVQAVKKRLARTEAAPEENSGSGKSGDKSLAQLKAEISAKELNLSEVVVKLEEAKKQQETLPEFSARYADLTRSYDSSKKLYDQLFQERNGAEYQLGFERTAAEGRFEIVVPPRVEKQSAAKAYGKKIIMGLVAGVALGLGLAAFLQILKIWRRS